MSRADGLMTAGGLATGTASIVAGAGYVLTPATGPPGARFGAFGDPWVETIVATAGLAGGLALFATTVWLAGRLRWRRPRGAALVVTGTLVAGFALAAKAALWIHYRADPPLPPSWDWLRIPLAAGLLGAAAWVAGATLLLRPRAPGTARGAPRSDA